METWNLFEHGAKRPEITRATHTQAALSYPTLDSDVIFFLFF